MKCFVFLALLISSFAHAEPIAEIRAGLWTVNMIIQGPDGKEINPAKAIKAAMVGMSEENKKKMQEMMGNIQLDELGDKGVKVCYTEAMVQNPESIASHDDGNCDNTILTKTKKKIKTTFKCKDGATGTAEWTVKNPSAYAGVVNVDSPKGKSTLLYEGKFAEKDCGTVKPLGGTQKK